MSADVTDNVAVTESVAMTTSVAVSEGVAIIEATEPLQFALAGRLFEEYAAELGVDLCFQGFAAELTQLPVMYGPPGCLLLVLRDGEPVGCGALRFWADGICEMKRLYVRASERGGQLGRRVAEALIDRARVRGFRTMRLDTLAAMEVAQRMHQSLGFREVASYYDNPLPGTIYLELDLQSPAHIPAGTSVDKSQVGCVMRPKRS